MLRNLHKVLIRYTLSLGHIDCISIAPNKTMRIIATIVGPIKRFVDMEVLVSEIDGFQCPIDPQVI